MTEHLRGYDAWKCTEPTEPACSYCEESHERVTQLELELAHARLRIERLSSALEAIATIAKEERRP